MSLSPPFHILEKVWVAMHEIFPIVPDDVPAIVSPAVGEEFGVSLVPDLVSSLLFPLSLSCNLCFFLFFQSEYVSWFTKVGVLEPNLSRYVRSTLGDRFWSSFGALVPYSLAPLVMLLPPTQLSPSVRQLSFQFKTIRSLLLTFYRLVWSTGLIRRSCLSLRTGWTLHWPTFPPFLLPPSHQHLLLVFQRSMLPLTGAHALVLLLLTVSSRLVLLPRSGARSMS